MKIIRNDIAEVAADAIVASAGGDLRASGADPAVATAEGGALRCRVAVQAVAPRWRGGGEGEAEALRQCYREALEAARKERCESVAFPLLGTGDHGVPPEVSLRVAVDVLGAEEDRGGMACTLALGAEEAGAAAKALFGGVGEVLEGTPGPAETEDGAARTEEPAEAQWNWSWRTDERASKGFSSLRGGGGSRDGAADFLEAAARLASALPEELTARVFNVGPGVGNALMALMNQKHFDNRRLMLKTGISKQLLSKIQNGKHAKAPEKRWLLAFAVAMGLSLGETREFLATAGYALSKANKVDVVVEYFLGLGDARIEVVDAALACFGLPTLYPEE